MDRIKPEFVKKLSKLIVVLIWVLSLLVTHNFYMLRLTVQLVTHAIDKNYMFLLCNGLLVFVAKCSSFVISSKSVEEGSRKTDKNFDYGDLESYNAILELEDYSFNNGTETESFLEEEVTETLEDRVDSLEEGTEDEEPEEKEEVKEVVLEEEEEEEVDIRGGFEEEEENMGVVTEEDQDLNKKFDEFIRKMKEELRIEAKQHLIAV